MKRIILFTSILLISVISTAQQMPTVYSKDVFGNKLVDGEKKANYKRVFIMDIENSRTTEEVTRISDGVIVMRKELTKNAPSGNWIFCDKNGRRISTFDYREHICVIDSSYHQSVVKKPGDALMTKNQTRTVADSFSVLDVLPEFPGGTNELYHFLANNIRYPYEARESGIQGKVYVSFVIDKEGNVEEVCLLKGVHPFIDEEALRVISMMPLWSPGIQKGKAVRVSYNLPVQFRLR